MLPILLSGPGLEPVSLSEARAWLRLDTSDDDELVQALIVSARLFVEAEIRQVLIAQNWRLVGDHWPAGSSIPVRLGRVLAVSAARIFDAAGQPHALDPATIAIVAGAEPAAIAPSLRPAPGRARGGIEIDLRLGFGETAAEVPETIRLAIKRLVAFWYERRGDEEEVAMPPAIRALLRPFRAVRLGVA